MPTCIPGAVYRTRDTLSTTSYADFGLLDLVSDPMSPTASGLYTLSACGGQRGAVYDEASARIFKDFEEWEKSKEMSTREPSTYSQVSSSDTMRAVKGDGRARPFTTGRSSSDPVTHGRKQSGDTVVPLQPPDHEEGSTPPFPSFPSYPSIYGHRRHHLTNLSTLATHPWDMLTVIHVQLR